MQKDITIVRGKVTRIYPSGETVYFHVTGDKEPYGFNASDYNFISLKSMGEAFHTSYQLLLKAAEHKWDICVRRDDTGHTDMGNGWKHYRVAYIYADFHY